MDKKVKILIDIDEKLYADIVNGKVTDDQNNNIHTQLLREICYNVCNGTLLDGRPTLLVNNSYVRLTPYHVDALLLVDSRISFAKAINRMTENFDNKQEFDIDNMSARDLEKAFPDIPAPRYDGNKNIILYSGGF